MKTYSRTLVKVNLNNIEENMERMYANLKEGTKMAAVVKADGYGHGAVPIAKLLEPKTYIWGFAVATLDEGLILRKQGITKPILCLGCVFPDQYKDMIKQDIRMTLYDVDMARAVAQTACRLNMAAKVHIKLDTGMTRLGFPCTEEGIEKIQQICMMEGIYTEGMFTHFATADETDKARTMDQLARYNDVKKELLKKNIQFPYYHVCNSAAIIDLYEISYPLVRAGIAMYGMYPSEEVNKKHVALKPALSWEAKVTYVKWIEPGTKISYGGTFEAKERMKIATIPVGYGDGYPRSLSNKGYVLIHGEKAPIVGRVCMDQFMVDVTRIENVKFQDTVTLVGENQGQVLPVEVLSELSGRFNYEFVCDINKRVPREYLYDGQVIEQIDYN